MFDKVSWINIIVGSLITFRLTSLIFQEEGPFDIFGHIRDLIGVKYDEFSNAYGTNVLSKMLVCPKCISVWIGWFMAFVIYGTIVDSLLMGLVYSSLTIILWRLC